MVDSLTNGRKKKIHKDKKALGIFLLKYLHKEGRPLQLGEFFFGTLPNTGMDYFREILNELAEKKWIIIKEETGHIPGFPYFETSKFTYTISIDGIDYLSSITMIGRVTKFIKNNLKVSVSISLTALVIGCVAYFFRENKSVALNKQKQSAIKSIQFDSSKFKK